MLNIALQVYIAHNFSARIMLRDVVAKLEEAGFECTSRWITDDQHLKRRVENATEDVEDIERADVLMLFTDQFGERPGKGKWFEFGLAVGLGIPVFLIGSDTTCVFTALPDEEYHLYRFPDFDAALQGLKDLEQRVSEPLW